MDTGSVVSVGRLANKACIVTGSAQGIGFEVARAIAREGGRVMLADIGTHLDGTGTDSTIVHAAAEEIRSEGGVCAAQASDVTDPAQTDALVAATVQRFGHVDVLVNVAGILRRGSILEASDEAWQMTFDAHVNGTRNTMRSVGARWRDTPGRHRRVINISSDSGLYGDADYAAYAAAKAAVIGLTLSAAVTLAEVGATANVFIPQALTRMTRSIPADELPDNDRARWDSGEFAAANVPPVLLFVASDEADWMSGRIVGGWGFEAHQYSQAARARSIYSPGPWDLDALFVALPGAFHSLNPAQQ